MTDEVTYDFAGATDVGRVRDHNEDNFLNRSEIGLWVVADGMGGHAAGEVASAAVVEALGRIEVQESARLFLQACEHGLTEANARIRAVAEQRGLDIIGTTVVALLTYGRHFACLWSGDSRIYLVRGGTIVQLTRDHTEAQELVDSGVLSEAEARVWPRRNVITRAIGVSETPEVDLQHGELEDEDIFILCSDGLTAHVEAEEILPRVLGVGAEQACRELIDLTLERGARDNVTVIIVRYRPRQPTLVQPGRPAQSLWG